MWKEHDLVMLSSIELQPQMICLNNKTLEIAISRKNHLFNSKCKPQHLYVLSDEDIKEKDLPCYIYYKGTNSIQYIDMVNVLKEANKEGKKIIATTDVSLNYNIHGQSTMTKIPQIPQSFIEKYVEQYNQGNVITKVMVAYDHFKTTFEGVVTRLQINQLNNTINIKTSKDSWTREELKALFDSYGDNIPAQTIWQDIQNL